VFGVPAIRMVSIALKHVSPVMIPVSEIVAGISWEVRKDWSAP
jgi:hypothetical protein